jgi:hypothetical protein
MSQLNFLEALEAKERGINQALTHAEQVIPEWKERAYKALEIFVRCYPGSFMAEQVREFAEENGLPQAPSNRAWGGIIRRAAMEGLIKRAGFGTVSNVRAHSCFASVWIKN